MKKLLAIIILSLCFITPSQANDVRDFQIEGVSIGDSMLDFMDEEQIKKEIRGEYAYHYKNSVFVVIGDVFDQNVKTYESLSVTIKPADPKYIIYGVRGKIKYPNELKKCLEKKREVIMSVKNLFKNLKMDKVDAVKHGYDAESLVYANEFYFPNDDQIRIFCVNWSAKTEAKRNWSDGFNVSAMKWELADFINKGGMQ